MKKINIIKEHPCYKGVEFRVLNEIVEFKNGKGHEQNIVDNGKFIVVNSKFISTDGEVKKYSDNQICPLFVDDILMVMSDLPNGKALAKCYIVEENDKYTLNQRICSLQVKDSNIMLPKFLYYILNRNIQLLKYDNGVDQTNLRKDDILNIKIPVPPLDLQKEIIDILDKINTLIMVEEKEKALRIIQFEYYRDMFLNQKKENIRIDKMGNVLTFLNGRAYKQEELLNSGKYPVLRVGNFYTNYSWYYSDLELPEDKYCDKGDLLYSWAATLGPKIWDGNKCIYHYHIWKIIFDEKQINKKYLYYYLQNDLANLSSSVTNSTMIHISMTSMKERDIVIPTLEEQEMVVNKIECFDKLANDVIRGLPSEIEKRKKQFEYYKDLLLDFKEA